MFLIKHTSPMPIAIKYFFMILFGSMSCFAFNFYLLESIVLSASASGLIGSLVLYRNKNFQQAFYCGCFIAMSSESFLLQWQFSLSAVIVATLVFYYSTNYFKGFGGKLGTIAFFGCLAGMLWSF